VLAWGEPALVSAISNVVDGKLFYRGQEAIALADRLTHEETAALLRGGEAAEAPADRATPPHAEGAVARMLLTLAARASQDAPLAGRRGVALGGDAAALLAAIVDAVAGEAMPGAVHDRLARAWGHGANGEAADAIRRTLVLLADHELNPSAFAARVAASTGASLAAAALAGLATLTGPRHGGAPAAIRQLLARAETAGVRAAIVEAIADARPLPGFGHPLYASADPRAEALLARVSLTPALAALRDEARDYAGLFPNVDFALIAVAEAYRLPQEAPIALFATARAAGWIAHAIEQAESGVLIRPRARYAGARPAPSD
jgi:citrate synthase